MAVLSGSPSISITENDLTSVVPGASGTTAAFVGAFRWGPANVRVQISNEAQLRSTFLTPDSNTFLSFFSGANYLAYGTDLRVVRAVAPGANNSTATGTGVQIQNESIWDATYFSGGTTTYGEYAGRYPGGEGNSLTVSTCPGAYAWSKSLGAIANVLTTSNVVTFSSNISGLVAVGDVLNVNSTGNVTITSVAANGLLAVANTTFGANANLQPATASWAYASYFNGPPGTSGYATQVGGANDQMHVVVVDTGGVFSSPPVGQGGANTVIEIYPYVSKAVDARNDDGTGNYVRDVIRSKSRYIHWMTNLTGGTNWGNSAPGTTFTTVSANKYSQLSGGLTVQPADGDLEASWSNFTDSDLVDIDLMISGSTSQALATYLISNVVEVYKYAVLFLSPRLTDVVQVPGQELGNITTFISTLPASNRTFIDCNWKYMLDRYNNVYRWVPCNPDVAGTCARTDQSNDPWWSPAGPNRGSIKNVTKLAWNPSKTQRDTLYPLAVNPIVNFSGQGPLLFGDKTFTTNPSAFSRINVRRLFINLEKSLGAAARFSLFEFNDEFTRANFVNLVTPYLQDVKGRRGITDFYVVCDDTNNTQQVVQNNQFVGTIMVKPNYSINWIQLNMVAVNQSATFTTQPVSF